MRRVAADRADELAWWGKEEGPYSRLAGDGSGEGEGLQRPEPNFEERRQQRVAAAARSKEQQGALEVPPEVRATADAALLAIGRGRNWRRPQVGSEEDGIARRTGDNGDEGEVINEIDGDGFAVFDSLAFGRGLGSS